ncbi:unnamed protein product, partial [Symbiodinium sp. KB8]
KIDDFDAFPLAPDERSCQNHCWDNAFCYLYVYLSEKAAYVLIIGSGVVSHWCSLWIFESGQVYSMELTAINEITGSRWLQSRYKMRRLHSRAQLKDVASALSRERCPEANAESCRRSEFEGSESCVKDLSTFPEVVELVWPIVQDIVRASGSRNYVMSDVICIGETSPHDLRKRASMLFILQLLCGQYGVEFDELPLAVGSVIAGPTLLVLEVTFVAFFHNLQHHQPCAAMLVGIAWVAAEIYLTWRYVYSYDLRLTSGIVVGPVSTVLVWIVICSTGASDSAFAGSIPVLSLVWDMCLVAEALTVNMVFQSPALALVNLLLVAVAIITVAYLQWIDGWPVQDLLVPLCGVPIAVGSIMLAALFFKIVRNVPTECILFAAALLLASFILPVVALVKTLEFLSQRQTGIVKL